MAQFTLFCLRFLSKDTLHWKGQWMIRSQLLIKVRVPRSSWRCQVPSDAVRDALQPGSAPHQPSSLCWFLILKHALPLFLHQYVEPSLGHIDLHCFRSFLHDFRWRDNQWILFNIELDQVVKPTKCVRKGMDLVVAEIELTEVCQVSEGLRKFCQITEIAAQIESLEVHEISNCMWKPPEFIKVGIQVPQRPQLADRGWK